MLKDVFGDLITVLLGLVINNNQSCFNCSLCSSWLLLEFINEEAWVLSVLNAKACVLKEPNLPAANHLSGRTDL